MRRTAPQDKPVKSLLVSDQKPQIPRKPKKKDEEEPVANGSEKANGKRPAEDPVPGIAKRARGDSDAGSQLAKRPKVAEQGDDVIVIDEDEVISLD